MIKVQVTDHFEQLEEEEDADYDLLKDNLMSVLKSKIRSNFALKKSTDENPAGEATLPRGLDRKETTPMEILLSKVDQS